MTCFGRALESPVQYLVKACAASPHRSTTWKEELPPPAPKTRTTLSGQRCSIYLAAVGGDRKEEAMEKLRVFFGWSRDSLMPLLYAKAAFTDRLQNQWGEEFDERVAILRSAP